MIKKTIIFLSACLMTVGSVFANDNYVFTYHQADPSVFDPYADQEVKITWQQDVDSLITIEIEDDRGEVIKTLINKQYFPAGKFSYNWDGQDKYGQTAEEGDYLYTIISDSPNYYYESIEGQIFINRGQQIDELQKPRLTFVHATKNPWDAAINEPNFLNFTLNEQSNVLITAHKDQEPFQEIYEILDSNLEAGDYSVPLQPEEFDQEPFAFKYRIYAQNSRGYDLAEGIVDLTEETPDGRQAPNIFNDTAKNGNPYNPKNNNFEINFNLDRQADVSLEIRNGDFIVANVTTDTTLTEGNHSFYWNGRDNFGTMVSDGVYEYKLLAANFKGKDTEKGSFFVQGSTAAQFLPENCAGFNDLSNSHTYCDSIKWAKNNGIFQGYPDGSFKPDQPISRIEAVKVVLEAMNVSLIDNKGQNLGFPDTENNSWYQDYLRTALSLGIVRGYQDGYFRPAQQVKRAEGAIIVLNTARAIDNILIPSHSYGQPYYDVPNNEDTSWYFDYAWLTKEHNLTDNEFYFYPLNPMTRAEMADYLYRYKTSSL